MPNSRETVDLRDSDEFEISEFDKARQGELHRCSVIMLFVVLYQSRNDAIM